MVSRTRFHLPPRIPGFRFLRLLGQGGMGETWLVVERATGRQLVLKTLREDYRGREDALVRFKTEIEATRRCEHTHVVCIFDDGEAAGLPWYTMEYAAHGSMRYRLRGRRLPLGLGVRFIELLARTVDYIHQSEVVHRDLSLDNVLITAERVFKVSDFGLARFTDRMEGQGTLIYHPAGRLTYMSPEVGRGDLRRAGPATDIFALGVIFSEVLTGRAPFAQRRTHLGQVRNPPVVPPSHWLPELPRGVDHICLKCLAHDPADRYETAEALADDLRRLREGKPLVAQPWFVRIAERARGLFFKRAPLG
jgi:serine/threonine protein kinase